MRRGLDGLPHALALDVERVLREGAQDRGPADGAVLVVVVVVVAAVSGSDGVAAVAAPSGGKGEGPQRPPEEQVQVEEVGRLVPRHQRVRPPFPPRPRDAARPVHEQLWRRREVVVDDGVEVREVEAARGDVRDDEDGGAAGAEAADGDGPGGLVHAPCARGGEEWKKKGKVKKMRASE